MEGRIAVHEGLDYVIHGLTTTHFITNVRIAHTPGEKKAKVTTSAQAVHYRNGDGLKAFAGNMTAPRFVSGGIYYIDAVKDDEDGLWRVERWELNPHWVEGDASVMSKQ